MKMPKGFSLCGSCPQMFIILDIKMVWFKTLIHFKNDKHIIFNMNNIFFNESNYKFQTKNV